MDLFSNGESYHETFHTSAGWLLLIAEVRIVGKTIELHNILIEPIEVKHLSIGTAQVYDIRRKLVERVKQAGYTSLVIEGKRSSGASPGRAVRIRRKL